MNAARLALILCLTCLGGCATMVSLDPEGISEAERSEPIAEPALDLATNCTPVKSAPSPLKDGDGIGGTGCPAM